LNGFPVGDTVTITTLETDRYAATIFSVIIIGTGIMPGTIVTIPKAVFNPTVQVNLIDGANAPVVGSFAFMDSAGVTTTHTTETNGSKVIIGLA
jgi:hypothetical protein